MSYKWSTIDVQKCQRTRGGGTAAISLGEIRGAFAVFGIGCGVTMLAFTGEMIRLKMDEMSVQVLNQ